jgi:hypothetical protein
MSTTGPFVKHTKAVVNLDAIAGAHWEKDKLFVHYIGGRFESFLGDQADRFWKVISGRAFNLVTGEAPAGVGPDGGKL